MTFRLEAIPEPELGLGPFQLGDLVTVRMGYLPGRHRIIRIQEHANPHDQRLYELDGDPLGWWADDLLERA